MQKVASLVILKNWFLTDIFLKIKNKIEKVKV